MRKVSSFVLAAACAALAGSGSAWAAEPDEGIGFRGGDVLVRMRGLFVKPDVSNSAITPIGGDVSINNSFVPEIDVSYFFTGNIAAELIAAVTPHNPSANRTALGHVGLGQIWLLPPTLTAQWHFVPDGLFNPYVGVGVNYTKFFGSSTDGAHPAVRNVKYESSWGPAFQFGVDARVGDRWYLNVDVKKILISSDVKIDTTLGRVTTKVDIDPWIVGAGIGYKF